jgi:hypothetical protein
MGMLFLCVNKIVIDHEARTTHVHDTSVDLLNPIARNKPCTVKNLNPKKKCLEIAKWHCLVVKEIKSTIAKSPEIETSMEYSTQELASIRERVKILAAQQKLLDLKDKMILKFQDVFQEVVPPVHRLPTDVYCRITLKDASKLITTRTYSTPRKYR